MERTCKVLASLWAGTNLAGVVMEKGNSGLKIRNSPVFPFYHKEIY
jgi:hypothetical protein